MTLCGAGFRGERQVGGSRRHGLPVRALRQGATGGRQRDRRGHLRGRVALAERPLPAASHRSARRPAHGPLVAFPAHHVAHAPADPAEHVAQHPQQPRGGRLPSQRGCQRRFCRRFPRFFIIFSTFFLYIF